MYCVLYILPLFLNILSSVISSFAVTVLTSQYFTSSSIKINGKYLKSLTLSNSWSTTLHILYLLVLKAKMFPWRRRMCDCVQMRWDGVLFCLIAEGRSGAGSGHQHGCRCGHKECNTEWENMLQLLCWGCWNLLSASGWYGGHAWSVHQPVFVACHLSQKGLPLRGWSTILARPGSHLRNLMAQRFTVVLLTVSSPYTDCKRRWISAGVTFSALKNSVTACRRPASGIRAT